MSIEALNWALSQTTGSPAAKSILLILANRADHNGTCWPGFNGISDQTELSRRAVVSNIKYLAQHGFLAIKKRPRPATNMYQLNLSGSAGGALVQDPPSAADALAVVQEVHSGSAGGAPEPSLTTIKPKYRATKRVPQKWKPRDTGFDFAFDQGMLDRNAVIEQICQFRDHEFKTARKDWDAAWRTWCRNWKKWRKDETNSARPDDFNTTHARNRKTAGLD